MKEPNQAILIKEFIEGLGQASGAASQMIHMHQDPRWMIMRDLLESVRDVTMRSTVIPTRNGIVTPCQ